MNHLKSLALAIILITIPVSITFGELPTNPLVWLLWVVVAAPTTVLGPKYPLAGLGLFGTWFAYLYCTAPHGWEWSEAFTIGGVYVVPGLLVGLLYRFIHTSAQAL